MRLEAALLINLSTIITFKSTLSSVIFREYLTKSRLTDTRASVTLVSTAGRRE